MSTSVSHSSVNFISMVLNEEEFDALDGWFTKDVCGKFVVADERIASTKEKISEQVLRLRARSFSFRQCYGIEFMQVEQLLSGLPRELQEQLPSCPDDTRSNLTSCFAVLSSEKVLLGYLLFDSRYYCSRNQGRERRAVIMFIHGQ